MNKPVPAYLIANYLVKDPALLGTYVAQAAPVLQRFGGKIIALNPQVAPLEGNPQPSFIIIQFPSLADAKGFYESPEYAPVKPLRLHATANGFLFILEGLPA